MPLNDRNLILVDDGIATGASMRAAIAALRASAQERDPRRTRCAARDGRSLRARSTRSSASRPRVFYAIGAHYRDFHQLPDEEVVKLIRSVDVAREGTVTPS